MLESAKSLKGILSSDFYIACVFYQIFLLDLVLKPIKRPILVAFVKIL